MSNKHYWRRCWSHIPWAVPARPKKIVAAIIYNTCECVLWVGKVSLALFVVTFIVGILAGGVIYGVESLIEKSKECQENILVSLKVFVVLLIPSLLVRWIYLWAEKNK